jgi:predicted regulator of Ras-like GTPase activity (Roadblock/LC7/MglB family)
VLLHPNGQVMAQHGFGRAVDVMSACALAAAINASASELGRQLEGNPFRELYHGGTKRQLFLAPATTKRGTYLLLTVFDAETSLGLVRLYFEQFCAALAAAAPTPPRGLGPVLDGNFEQELNQNLTALFGRG